ncbi:MAG TPA: peptide MFS transporter [Gemmataceae bacterium]|nr:peptide MFS transporter [Gemmataceae bacterium]
MGQDRKHPPGLYVLFFTEMWERFGFYLMVGIFFLYMTDKETGGLGMSRAQAADVFGSYMALVYLTPFLGGLLADRYLGYRPTIMMGGLLMALGYLGLALPGAGPSFWLSLLIIILGNGLFKPNISTLLGNLYSDERYKAHKDAGYNIFYMGINIGAFICNFVAAYLRNHYTWGYAFAAGGIGMFIGLTIFLIGQGQVKAGDIRKPLRPEDMPLVNIVALVFAPAAVFGVIGWFVPTMALGHPFIGSQSTDAFLFACVPVVAFYFSLWWRASHEDRRSIGALLAIFGVVVVFWAIFNQAGTALTTWAENYTDRNLPAALAPAARTLGMVEEVDGKLKERPKLDAQFREEKDAAGNVIKAEEPNTYLLNLPKNEWPPEDGKLQLISTEIFQSINPFWVVVMTPVVVGFFNFLKKRGAEPSTPAKIAYGLTISALSALVMVGAVNATRNGLDKGSAAWLVGAYLVITLGELCLSPMGLSLVSKVSPPRLTALMMGGWFLSTSIGGKLSGTLASMWDGYDNKANFFLANMGLTLVAAVALFLMVPWLRGVVKEKTGAD